MILFISIIVVKKFYYTRHPTPETRSIHIVKEQPAFSRIDQYCI